MVTLMDYQDKGVMEPERFYETYKHLSSEDYGKKITEVYGPPSGRDKKMDSMVNAAIMAYASTK